MKLSQWRNRHGAALMLSLWALFLLSATVIAWALEIDARMSLSGNASRVMEAEAMASSGAEVALDPAVELCTAQEVVVDAVLLARTLRTRRRGHRRCELGEAWQDELDQRALPGARRAGHHEDRLALSGG